MSDAEVEVNSHGTNKAIKAHILSDDKMREIGFTDYDEKKWYYCKSLSKEISFSVTIPKDGSDIEICTLDEDWGQYYDYQYILERDQTNPFALGIKIKVEDCMRYLQNKGVLFGHEYGEYI